MSTLVKALDDAYHLAVNVFVLTLEPYIELTTELIWGGDDHASPQSE